MTRFHAWFLILVSTLLILPGCGGGGGGGNTGGNANPDTNAAGSVTTTTAALSLWVGNPAGADGKGAEAHFNDPSSVAVDSHGNLFVVDSTANTIRKITPDGTVTTFVGTPGAAGASDGVGPTAQFYFRVAAGITVDKNDNLYVTDIGNHAIRKITPSALVSTVATRVPFCADPTACATPGMATDSSGTVYFVDTSNQQIRKVLATGEVPVVWGKLCSSNPSPNELTKCVRFALTGLAIDASDRIYIAEDPLVRVLESDGRMVTYAGGNGRAVKDGVGVNAAFINPHSLSFDATGNLYVIDGVLLRKIAKDTTVTTVAGNTDNPALVDGVGTQASLGYPGGLAINRDGMMYVVDTRNQAIRKVTPEAMVTTLAGGPAAPGPVDGTGPAAKFSNIAGLVFDANGNLFATDGTIRKITPSAIVTTFAGQSGQCQLKDGLGTAAIFCIPKGIAIDSKGNLFVADRVNSSIRKITPEGAVTTFPHIRYMADGVTRDYVSFDFPDSVVIDTNDNMYAIDAMGGVIDKIDQNGVTTDFVGNGLFSPTSADGTGKNAHFFFPSHAVADKSGNLFVADTGNHTIRKVTPAGVVTTIAGAAGQAGYADGTGSQAKFNGPKGLAIDSADNIYVADTYNHLVRKITPAGVVTVVAGQFGQMGFRTGALPGILASPVALAIRGHSLYIAMPTAIAVATNVIP